MCNSMKVLESLHSEEEDTSESDKHEDGEEDYDRSSEDEKTDGDVKVIRKKFEWNDKTR